MEQTIKTYQIKNALQLAQNYLDSLPDIDEAVLSEMVLQSLFEPVWKITFKLFKGIKKELEFDRSIELYVFVHQKRVLEMNPSHTYALAHREFFKERFIELLKIKSISTDPAFAEDVAEAAHWIQVRMNTLGFSIEVIRLPEGRHPLVLGNWNGAGEEAKTVLIYCHYDVQPAAIEDGWLSDPFEPIEAEGKIFARGATDSKVHVIAWLSALEALLKTDGCPVNIKLLFEGEEESGSETVTAFITQFPEKAKADVVVISDGIIRSPEQPSLIYGLRGILTFELHLTGPQQDLHSGHFGGTVHNPAQAIAEIVAKLHDEQGRVTVPHFYDDVAMLTAEERVLLAASDADMEGEWQRVANAPKQWGEAEFSLHERIGARPTLEINGIGGGYIGEGFKTVLPAHALAKISCRLVPNQDPVKIMQEVQAYIESLIPPSIEAEFRKVEAESPAVLLDRHNPAMQVAFRAYEKGWGVQPIFERAGGSIPITNDMLYISKNLAIMGFSYKGGAAHGPNENIYLDMLYKGIDTAIYFLEDIGKAND
jgi:acetylornithine deacetylase/succinyl-diaminopimelate desuccinylase-like protein